MLQLREVQSSVDYPAVAQGPPVAQALPDRATPGWGRWSARLDVRPSPPGRGLVACGVRRGGHVASGPPGAARVQGG